MKSILLSVQLPFKQPAFDESHVRAGYGFRDGPLEHLEH